MRLKLYLAAFVLKYYCYLISNGYNYIYRGLKMNKDITIPKDKKIYHTDDLMALGLSYYKINKLIEEERIVKLNKFMQRIMLHLPFAVVAYNQCYHES
jgi:hypothetical protein